MKLFYVTATNISKGKEVTDTHAIIAPDYEHLTSICTNSFTSFEAPDKIGFQMNKYWEK